MKTNLLPLAALAAFAVFFVGMRPAAAQVASYTALSLGTLGGQNSEGFAINDTHTVTGEMYDSSQNGHAFTVKGAAKSDLGTLGGLWSYGFAVNSSGVVVGEADTNTSGSQTDHTAVYHAFVSSGGTMSDLGTFGGSESEAYGINASGTIVGTATTTSAYRAFVYSGGVMTDLGTLGGAMAGANAINDLGQIVGSAETGPLAPDHSYIWHAFLDTGGVMTDIGTLGGSSSYADGISSAGTVVGTADTASGASHAFVYAGGAMTDLGTLSGGTDSVALGVNASGVIVGQSDSSFVDINNNPATHGFVDIAGIMYDLNGVTANLGSYTITRASGISSDGWIAATGENTGTGTERAFLIRPASISPEPTAAALLLSPAFLTASSVFRRRRRRSFATKLR